MLKICKSCKVPKSLDSFSLHKGMKDGKRLQCKKCVNAEARFRYAIDPEKKKKQNARWDSANIEKVKAQQSVRDKKRYIENSAIVLENNARRRSKKVHATPIWANSEFEKFVIKELYALAIMRTKLTKVKHHVDHIVPLSSDIVQGFHCVSNLQILEAEQNMRKGNRVWPNMP